MPDESVQQTLTFESEETRQAALDAIPESPPSGTPDIDAWVREQEEKTEQIEQAQITAKSEEGAPSEAAPTAPETPPAQAQQPPAPVQETPPDEEIVIRLKRSELPEELQGYKDGQQIVKQYGHARGNMNRVSDSLTAARERIAQLEATGQRVTELETELKSLKTAAQTTQKAVEAAPAGPKKGKLQDKLASLNQQITDLGKVEEFDQSEMGRFRDTVSNMAGVMQEAVDTLSQTEDQFATYRQQSEQTVQGLKNQVDGYIQTSEETRKRQREEEANTKAIRAVLGLQDQFPELKTSKPLYSDDKKDVEHDVIKFCDAVYGGEIPREPAVFWPTVNRLVNLYNQSDQQMRSFCEKNGIFPANFGATDKDLENYAVLVNVDAVQRGERVDPVTGQRGTLKDFRGRQVTFPTAKAAYEYMLGELNIPQKEHEREVIAAEKKGQQSLAGSIAKRDVSDALIGPEGSGSPENIGQDMTVEMAEEILGEKVGQNTINEERMEVLLRMGDSKGWAMFDLLNRANKRKGYPEEPVESDWPPRPNAQ